MESAGYKEAKLYYDGRVVDQVRDWMYLNPRQRSAVEAALSFMRLGSPVVIEFGSGIGACGELLARELGGHVTSVDLSTELISAGKRLFGGANHRYFNGTLEELQNTFEQSVDQIILIDVLEHIRRSDWNNLFAVFGAILKENGQIFISTPTPWYQSYLQRLHPQALQPVDLSIERSEVEALGQSIGLNLVQYEEVDIYRKGDYQYFWLTSNSRTFDRIKFRKDGFLKRHWLVLRKWPRMYWRALSAKQFYTLVKDAIRGARTIKSRDSEGVAS